MRQRRQSRVAPLEREQTRNQETSDALGELKGLLKDLQSEASGFRLINGGGTARTAASSDETVARAQVSSYANVGNISIQVDQLAQNGNFSFNDRFASGNSVVAAGIDDGLPEEDRQISVTLGLGDQAETVNMTVSSNTTLNDLVEQFNSQSDKGTASLINVGTTSSPSYALTISTRSSGTEEGNISVSVDSAITDTGAFANSTLSQATDAKFSITGVSGQITRASNEVSDVIPGVTLSLLDTGSSTISVGVSAEETSKKVGRLVDSLNSALTFARENDRVEVGQQGGETTNSFGPLSDTSLDENLISSLRSATLSLRNSSGGGLSLSDIGVTTARDGTYELDTSKLEEALSSDPNEVDALLQRVGDTLGAVDGTVAEYTRFQGLVDQAKDAVDDRIKNRERRIGEIENSIEQERSRLVQRFSRLERLIGSMNSQQNALISMLPR